MMLATPKMVLSIPAGFGKSRVLMAGALNLALNGNDVTIYFMNRAIMERDRIDFNKILLFNKDERYPDAGDIKLEYGMMIDAQGVKRIVFDEEMLKRPNTHIL